jgi:hypothetical protein
VLALYGDAAKQVNRLSDVRTSFGGGQGFPVSLLSGITTA